MGKGCYLHENVRVADVELVPAIESLVMHRKNPDTLLSMTILLVQKRRRGCKQSSDLDPTAKLRSFNIIRQDSLAFASGGLLPGHLFLEETTGF